MQSQPERPQQAQEVVAHELSHDASASRDREAACALAREQAEVVAQALKESRKSLRRDWESLTPRERSAQSRAVKELEEQQQLLDQEIEIHSSA